MESNIIPTACIKLNDKIEQLSAQIKSFASSVREARRDLDSMSRELSSLSFCLETLREDATQLSFPDTLQRNLIVTVGHCEVDVGRIDGLLRRKLPQNGTPRPEWTTALRDELERYRSDLEGHKRTIDIALDMSSMLLIQSRPPSLLASNAELVKLDEPKIAPISTPAQQDSTTQSTSSSDIKYLFQPQSPKFQPRSPLSTSNPGTRESHEADSTEIKFLPLTRNDVNQSSTSAASSAPRTNTSAPTNPESTGASSEKEVQVSDEKELAFRRQMSAPIRRKAVPDPVEKEVAIVEGIEAVPRRPPPDIEWDSSTRLRFYQLPDDQPGAVHLSNKTSPLIRVSSLPAPEYIFPESDVTSLNSTTSSKVHLTQILSSDRKTRNNPLYHAISNSELPTLTTLLQSQTFSPLQPCGPYTSALEAACSTATFETVQLVLTHIILPTADPSSLALQASCARGSTAMIILLLTSDADINATSRSNKIGSALQSAIYHNKYSIAQLLLSKGADPNLGCGEYGNALHAAAFMLNVQMVKLLLDSGANIHAKGLFGSVVKAAKANKAAAYAEKQAAVLELLRSRGAKMSFLDRLGSDG